MTMNHRSPKLFWIESISLKGSITPVVMPNVLLFGLITLIICAADHFVEYLFDTKMGIEIGPHEVAGAFLGLLLILRTNAGYDRWWEARKLWGGIVNQSRNLVISGLSYGPDDAGWQKEFARWVAATSFVFRISLRGCRECEHLEEILGKEEAAKVFSAEHMPTYALEKLASLLREAREKGMDSYAFLQVDEQRALLMDHIGACERILKTPLPGVYSIKIRRLILLFFLTLPFALMHKLDTDWLIPFVIMLVAYPVLSLDQIGIELQNPFKQTHMNHLPLREICLTISKNARQALEQKQPPA